MISVRILAGGAAVLLGLSAAPAAAQQTIGGGFSLGGWVGAVTDYRNRGISNSDERPALQASLGLWHDSGFYAEYWQTTLGNDRRLGNLEVDLTVGYAREIASGTEIDVGVVAQLYPGGDGRLGESDFVEPYAAIRHTLGPVTAEVGALYAPEQDALGGADNVYLYGDLRGGIPFTPVTLSARVGHTSGGQAPGGDDYLDWRVGVEVRSGPATLGLDYVDTDLPEGPDTGATLVASVRFGF